MPFKSVADIAAAYDNGRWHHQRVYRNTSQYASPGLWTDQSMSGGTPKYNAYIGNQLESTALVGSGNNGIYTGPTPAAGMTKHVAKIEIGTMSTTVPVQHAELRDLLMFYPLIDGDSTDLQELVQVDSLPRYRDGAGVKATLVVTGGAGYNNASATITYTNSAGVSGRTTSFYAWYGSTTNVGVQLNSSLNSAMPFIPLAAGDTGIRSVESIQLASGTGLFFAMLLYKPLCNISMLESTTRAEIDFVNQRLSLPRVYDGAYLAFANMFNASASSTLPLHAGIDFIWG